MSRPLLKQWWVLGLYMAGFVVGVLALGTLLSIPRTTESREETLQVAQNDASSDATLRELAERLISPPFMKPDSSSPRSELLPGNLPGDLPLDLPMPKGNRLIGSARHGSGTEMASWDVVLDAPGKAEDVEAFFKAELEKRNWKAGPDWNRRMDMNRERGGFATSGPGGMGLPPGVDPDKVKEGMVDMGSMPRQLIFCQVGGKAALDLQVTPRGSEPNDVRIKVDGWGMGPCSEGWKQEDMWASMESIPPLRAPEGVEIRSEGSSGGDGSWSSEASAVTDKSATLLEAHYAGQLQAAGWTRLTGRAEGPLAWSLWQVPVKEGKEGDGKDEMQGFLYVLETPGQNLRRFHVSVDSPSARTNGGGWSVMVGSNELEGTDMIVEQETKP